MLTRRENLLKAIHHETPEWIPLTTHVDPYNQPGREGMDPTLAKAMEQVVWAGEATVTLSRYLDIDIADFFGAPIATRQQSMEVERIEDGLYVTTIWHAPGRDLRQVQRFSPDTNLYYTEKHMVEAPADLPALAAVFDDQEYELTDDGREAIRRRKELIGDDGILMLTMPGTPLGMMIRVHAGVENIAYLHADAPQDVRDLFAVMQRSHLRRLELTLSAGPDLVIGMDDTSTTTQSPAMLAEYCTAYTDRVADACHAADVPYWHHSCGLIRDLLPVYRQTKMDGVHAFCSPPLGNATIADGRERLGEGITICAPLVQISGDMSDRGAVAASIREMFVQAGRAADFVPALLCEPAKGMDDMLFVTDQARKHLRMYAGGKERAG